MSIAISVVVRPSRLAFCARASISLLSFVVGVAIAGSMVGEIGPVERTMLAASCGLLAAAALYDAARNATAQRLDISGIGQIRLVETTALAAPALTEERADIPRAGEAVSLMDDSTFWPFLMVLRLRSVSGRKTTVIVLPDSVGREQFRALSVACRWIAAHRDPVAQTVSSKMSVGD